METTFRANFHRQAFWRMLRAWRSSRLPGARTRNPDKGTARSHDGADGLAAMATSDYRTTGIAGAARNRASIDAHADRRGKRHLLAVALAACVSQYQNKAGAITPALPPRSISGEKSWLASGSCCIG